jgi:hypothetical protein
MKDDERMRAADRVPGVGQGDLREVPNQKAHGVYAIEPATVYRAGGRRWFSRRAAIRAYARAKFRAKHPCECEQPDYSSGYGGFICPVHDGWARIEARYLRVIERGIRARDGEA